MKLRVGRHNLDIVYLQLGAEADDADRRVAVFTEAGQAGMIVQLVNAVNDPRWWSVFQSGEL